MRVLAINGSPRRGGNTELLLKQAVAGAKAAGAQVETLVINELNFVGCQDCGGCNKEGICVIKDDMQAIYEMLKQADGLIFASPVFFGSLSSQSKKLIDRLQAFWVARNILKKKISDRPLRKGVFICVEASKRESFFKNASEITRHFFATAEFEYSGELFCSGVDKKGAILKDKECLQEAYQLGRGLAIK